jgi:uncharacterized protein with FMN-binding domain
MIRVCYALMALFILFTQTSCKSLSNINPFSKKTAYIDGVYEGEYKKIVTAKVRVTIDKGRIDKIEMLDYKGWRDQNASKIIPERIIKKQRTDVKIVTGATVSSEVIMIAVNKALEGAIKQ